eukprot:6269700-Pyramimonas_sp.AAC.1
MQAPFAVMAVLEQLYRILDAMVMINGMPTFASRISSGIIQGCSFSGYTYAAVTACSLPDLQVRLEGARLGLARACADDIGCVVKQRQALRIYA